MINSKLQFTTLNVVIVKFIVGIEVEHACDAEELAEPEEQVAGCCPLELSKYKQEHEL